MDTQMNISDRPAARLGGYREWSLRGPVARVCEAVWIYDAGHTPVPHRLLPDAKPSLIVRLRKDRHDDISACDFMISGGLTLADWYRPDAGETMIGLRLYPESAQGAAALDPRDFANGRHAAPDPLSRHFSALVDTAPHMSHEAIALALIEKLRSFRPDAEADIPQLAASGIRASRGRVPVSQLASKLEIGERQLRRRFERATGLTPKQYGRLIRHLNAIRLAEAASRPDWAGIAIEAGYADQSHMIREAKSISGDSPSRLLAERRAESEMSNTGGELAAI